MNQVCVVSRRGEINDTNPRNNGDTIPESHCKVVVIAHRRALTVGFGDEVGNAQGFRQG